MNAVDVVAFDDVHEDVQSVLARLRLARVEPEEAAVLLGEVGMSLADMVGRLLVLDPLEPGAGTG